MFVRIHQILTDCGHLVGSRILKVHRTNANLWDNETNRINYITIGRLLQTRKPNADFVHFHWVHWFLAYKKRIIHATATRNWIISHKKRIHGNFGRLHKCRISEHIFESGLPNRKKNIIFWVLIQWTESVCWDGNRWSKGVGFSFKEI